MKIYKRRGCLPFRFISKTKVEAPRGKEVAIDPFRSIHASKNGKKAVSGWPTEGNRARDRTEIVQEIIQETHGKKACRKPTTGTSEKKWRRELYSSDPQ